MPPGSQAAFVDCSIEAIGGGILAHCHASSSLHTNAAFRFLPPSLHVPCDSLRGSHAQPSARRWHLFTSCVAAGATQQVQPVLCSA